MRGLRIKGSRVRGAVAVAAFLLLLGAVAPAGNSIGQDIPPVRLSGPPVAETLPLVALAMDAETTTDDATPPYVFIPWHSPDQLRALVAGGQVDGALVTVAAAARLAERGVPVRVALVLAPPGWILSARGSLDSMAALRGQEVLMPFGPGEMPEALFMSVASAHGLAAGRDYTLRYCSSAMEVVQHLLLGHADFAFVSEPAASIALSRSAGGDRPLTKGLDMRAAWGRAFPDCPELATTAIVLFGPRAADEKLAQRLSRDYRARALRTLANPDPVAAEAARHYPEFASHPETWRPLKDMRVVDNAEAEHAARFYLKTLSATSPTLRVGHLPQNAFPHARTP